LARPGIIARASCTASWCRPPAFVLTSKAVSISTRSASGTTTRALAARVAAWRGEGRDVALVIGGPDGLDPALKARADETLRLSDLTLPHALARVLLAEALYRAWTLLEGHPYHRE